MGYPTMCKRFADDVLLDYRQGRLPAAAAAELTAHIADCPSCQAALSDLEALQTLCTGPAPEPRAVADRRVENLIRHVANRNKGLSPIRRAAGWTRIAAGIALVIGAGWAWLGGWFVPSSPAQPVIATLTR